MDLATALDLVRVGRLDEGDENSSELLQRLVRHAVSLVPGCTAAGLTVSAPPGGVTVAVSDDRVTACHEVQFETGGNGPAREALRHDEPRRVDDMDRETRWPAFQATARTHGLRSCLALPLSPGHAPAAAVNLYADAPGAFTGTTHDVALLFAAQGGVALDNADLYRQSRELVDHLHEALATRGMVERARGLLMSRHQLGSAEAFAALRAESQRTHRKLRDVAAALLDEHDPERGSACSAWHPPRESAAVAHPLADEPGQS